ncbi:FAD-binding protein [uncultured Litoreibacter sp.]|uniref:FAD-binding protein n=1 Tax=uncultured Litoreibacter sp. TaxID=1392394 RepID=UPI0026065C5E|nr:FAD-binding protein [uncultured Litoreibacter sp.]
MTPDSEHALAEAVASATSPIRVQGGGTRLIEQVDGDVLSTTGLSGITLYEPGSLTLVAKAGTPVAQIEAALAAENQRLPFEPMDHRTLLRTTGTPTIGGVVATNASGPRRIQAGACRDSLIGVRYVDGQGTIIKNGGRVMKNVTGYDLVKLMAGSYGTLGVMSEVSFKVLPGVETSATLLLHKLDVSGAVDALSKALGSPYEVSGAAQCLVKGITALRLEGFEESVSYRLAQLRNLLVEYGDMEELHGEASEALWLANRDMKHFSGVEGDIWRISVKPSDAPAVVASMPTATNVFLDWGGGLIWAVVPQGTDVRTPMGRISGHATCLRGSAQTFPPEPPVMAALSEGLRAQFDPRGILNQGVMG